jgi:hypothetical protein
MGLINFGVPREYVEGLRVAFGIGCFVETGTYGGRTASWAAERFERVITVELSEPLYRRAAAALARFSNVTAIHGDTRRELARLAPSLPPAIVWLDAHWCGGPSAGIGDECPLLGEIAALAPAWERLYVMVDDARYFLAPPPAEHDAAQWPSLAQLVNALNTGEGRFVASFEDVLVSLPPAARDLTLDYIRSGGPLNVRVLGHKRREPPAPPPTRLQRLWRRIPRRIRARNASSSPT